MIKQVSDSQMLKKRAVWQFIKYTLISLLTTVVELGSFSLFNYLVFTQYSSIEFKVWMFNYSVVNGGLCAFLSFALSYIIAQTFNFLMQRKTTFKSTNKVLTSAILYIVMILVIFYFQMWLPTLIRVPLSNLVGDAWADMIIKNMMMTLSFLIQFPLNKWVIMRNKPKITSSTSMTLPN